MPKKKTTVLSKEQYTVVVSLMALFLVMGFFYLLSQSQKGPFYYDKEGAFERTDVPKELLAGDIGEVAVPNGVNGERGPLISSSKPPVISSTVGTIKTIEEGYIIIKGNGSNFADGIPREIFCIFTDKTLTFTSDRSRYEGNTGLDYFRPGMIVLVGGEENIRGKTEFKVKTVNILEQ